jgi:hypothetical protein
VLDDRRPVAHGGERIDQTSGYVGTVELFEAHGFSRVRPTAGRRGGKPRPAIIPVAWLAVGPLLGSLLLSPRITAALEGWAVLRVAGLLAVELGRPGMLVLL